MLLNQIPVIPLGIKHIIRLHCALSMSLLNLLATAFLLLSWGFIEFTLPVKVVFSQCLWYAGHTSLSAASRTVKPYNLLTSLGSSVGRKEKKKRQLKDTTSLYLTKFKIKKNSNESTVM